MTDYYWKILQERGKKMNKKWLIVGLCIWFLLGFIANAEEPEKTLDVAKIYKLVWQLGEEDRNKYEAAREELIQIGNKLFSEYKQKKQDAERTKVREEIEIFALSLWDGAQSKDAKIKIRAVQIQQYFHFITQPKIAFISNGDINIMDISGQFQQKLTDKANAYWHLAWSPDGQKIAFASNRDGNWEIYSVDIAGKNLQRLTQDKAIDKNPTWNHDGTRIAFDSNRDGEDAIYVMDADGRNVQRLLQDIKADCPSWSPDGKKIACVSYSSQEGSVIYVMDADGRNLARLTHGSEPSWSPDGAEIVFEDGVFSAPNIGYNAIHIIDTDGKNRKQLSAPGRSVDSCSFDGNKIVFVDKHDDDALPDVDGNHNEIYVMDTTGENIKRLTVNQECDEFPALSPCIRRKIELKIGILLDGEVIFSDTVLVEEKEEKTVMTTKNNNSLIVSAEVILDKISGLDDSQELIEVRVKLDGTLVGGYRMESCTIRGFNGRTSNIESGEDPEGMDVNWMKFAVTPRIIKEE